MRANVGHPLTPLCKNREGWGTPFHLWDTARYKGRVGRPPREACQVACGTAQKPKAGLSGPPTNRPPLPVGRSLGELVGGDGGGDLLQLSQNAAAIRFRGCR